MPFSFDLPHFSNLILDDSSEVDPETPCSSVEAEEYLLKWALRFGYLAKDSTPEEIQDFVRRIPSEYRLIC
jgi:hypothetical protein